jgi:hypothetical protein
VKETDAIFENLMEVHRRAAGSEDTLRLSCDAKAPVLIGPFSRGGKSRRGTKGADHDFKPLGKLTPFGIFLPDQKELNFYFTSSKVTSDTGLEKRANFDRLERATWDVSFLVLIFQVREEFVSFFVSFLTRALNAQMLSSSRSQSTLRWIDERSRLRPAATMKLRKSPLSHIIYNFICLNIIK